MKVFLHPKSAKELGKLDAHAGEAIRKKLSELKKFPERGKRLKHSPFRSLRIGDYRAIYETKNNKIIVLFVGHRKKVYDDFTKLF